MTLNIWHYIFFVILIIIFFAATFVAYRLKKHMPSIMVTNVVFLIMGSILTLYFVDSTTKKAKILNLKSKRMFNTEQIVFSGVVQNSGKYKIGSIELEVKLLNKGQFTTDTKAGEVFKTDSFFGSLIRSDPLIAPKPQHITQKFIIAKDLEAGNIKHFNIYMPYPPYFSDALQYFELRAH